MIQEQGEHPKDFLKYFYKFARADPYKDRQEAGPDQYPQRKTHTEDVHLRDSTHDETQCQCLKKQQAQQRCRYSKSQLEDDCE